MRQNSTSPSAVEPKRNSLGQLNRRDLFKIGLMTLSATAAVAQTVTRTVNGVLRPHPTNPRYFTDNSGRPVYLTGSHTWASLQDIGMPPIPRFDWSQYVAMMTANNHNFIRLWHWSQAAWGAWTPDKILFDPLPYARTGPGTALDGAPKFDLTSFNPAYFTRLRERVKDARDQGIYCSVQLFQSFSEHKQWSKYSPWPAHPYNGANNIQRFDAEKPGTGTVDLARADVREMQARYIKKTVDTVVDLDSVLYEVINEGGEKDWDWWVVDFVHRYEAGKGVRHPVGLTGFSSENLEQLLTSPADWISPGAKDGSFKTDPPACDGRKVSITDTDHLWGHGGTPAWVWKSFTRGHNPILMDPWDPIPGGNQRENWTERPGYPGRDVNKRDHWIWDPVRRAMGHSRTYALKMDLAAATPRNTLASTGYCLASPGKEYLAYLPEGDEVEMDLSEATREFTIEWMHPVEGRTTPGGKVKGGRKETIFVPFPGPAVLYLKAV